MYFQPKVWETFHKAEALITTPLQRNGKKWWRKTSPFNYKFLSMADEIQQQQT